MHIQIRAEKQSTIERVHKVREKDAHENRAKIEINLMPRMAGATPDTERPATAMSQGRMMMMMMCL